MRHRVLMCAGDGANREHTVLLRDPVPKRMHSNGVCVSLGLPNRVLQSVMLDRALLGLSMVATRRWYQMCLPGMWLWGPWADDNGVQHPECHSSGG